MSLWLYEPRELEGISDQDKALLNREIQHYIDTDPIVRAIMIVDRGAQEPDDDDPILRAIKFARTGLKKWLKEQLKPLYERMKSGGQPPTRP